MNEQQQQWSLTETDLASFSEDVEYLWSSSSSTIPVLNTPPSAFEFYRDFVSQSLPCIIRGTFPSSSSTNGDNENGNSTSYKRLTLDDLVNISRMKRTEHERETETMLTVDVTPDGHGDCVRLCDCTVHDNMNNNKTTTVTKKIFVKPEQKRMSIEDFRTKLRRQKEKKIRDRNNIEPKSYPIVENAEWQKRQSTKQEEAKVEQQQTQETKSTQNDQVSENNTIDDEVLYYSLQNDCLRKELGNVFQDLFPKTFDFVQNGVFGSDSPEAINLWIGNELSVSAMHKDPYENLFYVLSGEKVFWLCPPADLPFLYEREFEQGCFCSVDSDKKEWVVIPEYHDMSPKNTTDLNTATATSISGTVPSKVRWIEPDISIYLNEKETKNTIDTTTSTLSSSSSSYEKTYPLLKHTHPIKIHVKEGEMLYLPALWFHRVSQTCETVGLNYWYDMRFDSRWCYFNLLDKISHKTE